MASRLFFFTVGLAGDIAAERDCYRNGQLLITVDVTTGSPVPTFSDDFNDNSLDTAKWGVADPNLPAVVSETGQRLQITLPPTGDTIRQKFTSYERDGETQLDYAQARYFSSQQGRFTSVDPLPASPAPATRRRLTATPTR